MADFDILKIKEIALSLAKNTEIYKKRDFLKTMRVGSEPRIKVLRGFRGVGKTTALLQLLGERTIYFSMDHPYIKGHNLYELSKDIIRTGYDTLLIDEIHYYTEWEIETKALYDEFKNVNIILSGSAPLAFEPERRYNIIDVEPMSLQEFVTMQSREIKATDCWENIDETVSLLASNPWLYQYYEQYMRGGAFPIFFTYGEGTLDAIYYSIRKSIREDAPFFKKVDAESTIAMEKLLIFLASSPLGEFSINSMSKNLEISKYKAYEIVSLLESMKILRLVRPYAKGASLIRGEPKLMFHHPNLRSAVCNVIGIKPDIGAIREELAVFCLSMRGWMVATIKGMKRNPDYIIEKDKEKIIIEIGGPSKSASQLAGFKERTLVLTDRQLITLSLF